MVFGNFCPLSDFPRELRVHEQLPEQELHRERLKSSVTIIPCTIITVENGEVLRHSGYIIAPDLFPKKQWELWGMLRRKKGVNLQTRRCWKLVSMMRKVWSKPRLKIETHFFFCTHLDFIEQFFFFKCLHWLITSLLLHECPHSAYCKLVY